MDEEVEIQFQLRPLQYTKWHVIGMGLNFLGSVAENAGELFDGLTMMTAQYCLKLDTDKEFERMINGS